MKLEVLKMIIEKGGASVKRDKVVSLKSGFMASYYGSEVKASLQDLNKVLELINNFNSGKNYLGLWVYNGYIYIDVSKRFTSKKSCIAFAKENKQLAIYDNKKGLTIEM